jgi:glycosyltransferase involved in cell wall biosynthesis
MPLRIAAKLPRADTGYFKDKLEPQIDGEHIQLIGEVNDAAKEKFLAGVAALLFPIDWPEPFGLVMIEALACGTPVIAFRSGSVPEVIDEGITGFIVEGEDQAVQAIRRIGVLDRRKLRAVFEHRFTAKRMAEEYVRQYEALGVKPVLMNGSVLSTALTAIERRRLSSQEFFQSLGDVQEVRQSNSEP